MLNDTELQESSALYTWDQMLPNVHKMYTDLVGKPLGDEFPDYVLAHFGKGFVSDRTPALEVVEKTVDVVLRTMKARKAGKPNRVDVKGAAERNARLAEAKLERERLELIAEHRLKLDPEAVADELRQKTLERRLEDAEIVRKYLEETSGPTAPTGGGSNGPA